MGHVRLGVLPKSRKWNQVVDELRLGADSRVAASAADAAETAPAGRIQRSGLSPCLLASDPGPSRRARSEFARDLRRLGVEIRDQPGLMDVAAAISAAVDRHAREQGGRTDLGEMARWRPSRALRRWSGRICRRYSSQPGRSPTRDRTFRGRRSLQRSGARVLCAPDAAQPRLLSEPRTLQPYRRGRAVSRRQGAIPIRRRAGPALPGSVPDRRSIRRWMVRQECLSARWPDAGRRSQVRPGCVQENPGGTPEAPRCRD